MEIREAAKQAKQDFEQVADMFHSPEAFSPEEAAEWVADRIVLLMEGHDFS